MLVLVALALVGVNVVDFDGLLDVLSGRATESTRDAIEYEPTTCEVDDKVDGELFAEELTIRLGELTV